MRFSDIELYDLVKAWVATSFAFTLLLGKGFGDNLFTSFLFSGLTVGVSFLLHELAHKFVAQSYGCFAEFRAFNLGLVLAVIMALMGSFVFAAPGAVVIIGLTSSEQNGKIALAGPVINIFLSLGFLLLGFLFDFYPLFVYGFTINSQWAFFNLLPLGQLDGLKVMIWDKRVWAIAIGVAAALFLFFFF